MITYYHMDIRDYLSDDGQAVLALCSPIGLAETAGMDSLDPFKLSEWNQLERQIQNSSLQQPAALQGRSAEELARELAISMDESARIVQLLGRLRPLALALENLFSRGMWAVSRLDERYPARLRDTLKHQAPSILFGAGEIGLLQRKAVAVVGSRNIDDAGTEFARAVGRKAAAAKMTVVSGGARGTDRLAMEGALESDGKATGALADSLETTFRKPDVREFIHEGRLVLVTPYAPSAGFSVGAAMGRNKIIYGLSDFAVVVSSDFQSGGTWPGAVEALKAGWCPVFVRDWPEAPKGNRELLKLGAGAMPESELGAIDDLPGWLEEHVRPKQTEGELFG